MTNKTLAWIVVGVGVLYLLYEYGKSTGSPLVSDLDPFFGPLDALGTNNIRPATAQQAAVLPYMRTSQPGNAPQQSYTQFSNQAQFPIGAVGTAGATAALAGTSAVTGLAVATAGIGAGVGLLAWGIVSKGWFRGGEEGVKVNPARDAFLAQFSKYDYMTDASNPPGFYGLALVLSYLDPNGQRGLFAALTDADTMDKFTRAVSNIENTLASATPQQYDSIIAQLAYYRNAA